MMIDKQKENLLCL